MADTESPSDIPGSDAPSPAYRLIHQLRTLTVDLDLLGAEFARANGLHPTDIRALIVLLDAARAGIDATPAHLGRELGGLNSATVTALLDRLERADLVRRAADSTDRRRVRLEVTSRAHEMGTSFFGPLIGRAVAATHGFSADELATVERFLDAVVLAVGEQRSAAD